jgi:hypothetical protein
MPPVPAQDALALDLLGFNPGSCEGPADDADILPGQVSRRRQLDRRHLQQQGMMKGSSRWDAGGRVAATVSATDYTAV